MDEEPVRVSDAGSVRTIVMNRPAKHNAQDAAMLQLLDDVLADTAADPDVRVVVLRGAGPSFTAGHDLNEAVVNPDYREAVSTAEGRWRWERRLFSGPVGRFRDLDVPTVCVVQGNCLAAGLMFVAVADLVIADGDAVFSSRIIPAMDINDAEVPALAWVLGQQQAKRLLWLGERIGASEARELGLVTWVEQKDALERRLQDVVERLLEIGSETLALSKASLRFMEDRRGWSDVAAYHFMAHQVSHQTTAARAAEGMRAARVRAGGPPVGDEHRGGAR